MSNFPPSENLRETQPYFPAQQTPTPVQHPMQPPPVSSKGCSFGCLLWGCLGTILVAALIIGLMSFFGYRYYQSQISRYTSDAPLELPSADISDEEVEAIVTRLEDFREQFDQGEAPQELVITIDEINALIANNPEMRGKAYVTIVDGDLRADVSVPLDELPGAKGRYFNGWVTLKVELEDGVLLVYVVDAEANDQPIPEWLMQGIREENIAKGLYDDEDVARTLRRCEELVIESDRIILKVRPSRESADEKPPSESTDSVEAEIGDSPENSPFSSPSESPAGSEEDRQPDGNEAGSTSQLESVSGQVE